MPVLTTNEQGQVTLPGEILQHLGVKRGEVIECELLPYGRVKLDKARATGSIDQFIGLLSKRTHITATLEEIRQATRGRAGN